MAKLKVINGGISLGEFTVDQLAEHTGVSAATIQTILTRNSPKLFAEARREKTGKPGGQPIVWKVDVEAARAYVAEHVTQGVLGARLQAEYSNLLWKVRDAEPAAVRSLLERARAVLRRMEHDFGEIHVQAIEALIKFAELELEPVSREAIAARNGLAHVARQVLSLDLAQLAIAILRRIEDSELSRELDRVATRALTRSTTLSKIASSDDSLAFPSFTTSRGARRERTYHEEIVPET